MTWYLEFLMIPTKTLPKTLTKTLLKFQWGPMQKVYSEEDY